MVVVFLMLWAFVMTGTQNADAAFILELEDLGSGGIITIADGSASDSNALAGVITYSGPVPLSIFTVNVTTGVSKPVLGGPTRARMDLNSVNISSPGSGNLRLRLTDTDFLLTTQPSPPDHIMTSRIGGTTDGNVILNQYLGPNNNQWEMGITPGPQGPLGPGAFSSTTSTTFSLGGGPFSLTEIVDIAHPGGTNITSFDAVSRVEPVPEPTTLLLLGCGLFGLAGYAWRRKKKQS
jgi:hypothetical protein